MKDYSNYRPPAKNKLLWSARKVFEKQLNTNGKDVLVDGVPIKALIFEHTNPLNEDRIDRKFRCSDSTKIRRGSIVEYDNRYWLVISEPKRREVYIMCKIIPCNNTLVFQDKDNPSIIHEVPCVLSGKASSYATGEDKNKYFVLMDDKILITVPDNEITRQIELKKRFIFDHDKLNVYEVTKIDTLTQKGLINITMKQDEYNPSKDRLDLNIADYREVDNNKPEEPLVEDGYVIVIEGVDTMVFMSTETFTAKIYNNGIPVEGKSVIWEVDKRFKAIEVTDTTCTIEVPIGDYSVGKFPIKAILRDDESVFAIKEIDVTVF